MKSPYVRFALGVLDGKYDENIFTGLIEIMMMKQDQEERGVECKTSSTLLLGMKFATSSGFKAPRHITH